MPQVVRIYSFDDDTAFWSISIPPPQPLSSVEKKENANKPTTVDDVREIFANKLGLPSVNGVELYEQGPEKSKRKGKNAQKAVVLNGDLIVEDIIKKWNPKNPSKLLLKYPPPPRDEETRVPIAIKPKKPTPNTNEEDTTIESTVDSDHIFESIDENHHNTHTHNNDYLSDQKDTIIETPYSTPQRAVYILPHQTPTATKQETAYIRVHYLLNPYTFWTIAIVKDTIAKRVLEELAEKLSEKEDSLDLYIFDQSQFGPRFQSEARLDLGVNVWRLYHRNKDLIKFLVGFKGSPIESKSSNKRDLKPLGSESAQQFDPHCFDEEKPEYKATYTDYPPYYLTPTSPLHSPPSSTQQTPPSFKTKNGLSVTVAKSVFQDSSYFSPESREHEEHQPNSSHNEEKKMSNWPPPLTQVGYPFPTENDSDVDNDDGRHSNNEAYSHSPSTTRQVKEDPSIFSFPQTQLGKTSFEQQWKQMVLGNRPKPERKEKRKSFEKEWRRVVSFLIFFFFIN
eukprot:TRINITY_DN4700_c0_g1_i5.p1 TRINITY_DN4700_c0_g1~~TRINITY_DN4700_c0_g1_i5.p1  ORF type:complete len:508 (+),score=134.38 TRINITY_DN4700_c0_g1_i5:161-1684(+)